MSENELKPCPFHNCLTCGCYDILYMRDKDWNTRPIEDALTARIAELEKALNIDTDLTIAGLRKELRDATARIAELEAVVDKLIWSVEGRVEFMYSKHQREFEDIVAEYKECEE